MCLLKCSFSKCRHVLRPRRFAPLLGTTTHRDRGAAFILPSFHHRHKGSGAISPLSLGGHTEYSILLWWVSRQQPQVGWWQEWQSSSERENKTCLVEIWNTMGHWRSSSAPSHRSKEGSSVSFYLSIAGSSAGVSTRARWLCGCWRCRWRPWQLCQAGWWWTTGLQCPSRDWRFDLPGPIHENTGNKHWASQAVEWSI